MSLVRKRIKLTLEEKANILNQLKAGERVCSISRRLNINESTIRTIRTNEKVIRNSLSRTSSARYSCYTRDSVLLKTERALVTWMNERIQNDLPTDGRIIKETAKQFYYSEQTDPSAIENSKRGKFQASSGWLRGFLQRHSFYYVKAEHGEKGRWVNGKETEDPSYDFPVICEQESSESSHDGSITHFSDPIFVESKSLNYNITVCDGKEMEEPESLLVPLNPATSARTIKAEHSETDESAANCTKPKLTDKCYNILQNIQEQLKEATRSDQHEYFGKNVAMKLRNMKNNNQRLLAEKIINEALFLAETNRLTFAHNLSARCRSSI